MKTDPIDRCHLHHTEAGSGPPLLLIHGLFDSLSTWSRLIPLLIPHFKVYAIDLPGFGESILPDRWNDSVSGMIDAVIAFLDEKGIGAVSPIGSSMGGSLSLAIAARHPERVQRIVLLNPYGLPALPMAAAAAGGLVSGMILPYLLRKEILKRSARTIFSRSLYDQRLLTDELIDRAIFPFSSLRQRKNLFRFLKGITSAEIRQIDALLPEIKRPVLILWGENDRWLSEEHLTRLQESLPNNQALKISRCGHLPQMDQPQEVAAATIRFMAGID